MLSFLFLIENNIDNKSDDEDINLKKQIKIKKSEQIESKILTKQEYEQNNKNNIICSFISKDIIEIQYNRYYN